MLVVKLGGGFSHYLSVSGDRNSENRETRNEAQANWWKVFSSGNIQEHKEEGSGSILRSNRDMEDKH